MPSVELIYDDGCPNVAAARANLVRALEAVNIPPRWQEWQSDDADRPERVRGYGSPTILVDGTDVAQAGPTTTRCCRLYLQPDGSMEGAPSVDSIVQALSSPR
jgi:mercuric ion transport protein